MFGKRAKTIKNKVTVNKQRSVAELMAIIERLKKELQYFQRYAGALEKALADLLGPDWKTKVVRAARVEPCHATRSLTRAATARTYTETPDPRGSTKCHNHFSIVGLTCLGSRRWRRGRRAVRQRTRGWRRQRLDSDDTGLDTASLARGLVGIAQRRRLDRQPVCRRTPPLRVVCTRGLQCRRLGGAGRAAGRDAVHGREA